jgi:antagonist of KipI
MIVGNPTTAAGLEMTMTGVKLYAADDCIAALTGATMSAHVGRGNDQLKTAMWTSFALRAGETLTCGNSDPGARTYLCIRGGIRGKEFFGSVATHLPSKLGGLVGGALKAGDTLEVGTPDLSITPRSFRPEDVREMYADSFLFRVTNGPQIQRFIPEAKELLEASAFTVSEKSNRMGLRLEGPPLQLIHEEELITEGISLGAIQVSGGQPIISFVDHQTTGGYPKICNIIAADLHKIGQLRPRDQIRFSVVSIDEAFERLKHLENLLSSVLSGQV